MKHAEMSRWSRHEDGNYAAEVSGHELRVAWHPESSGQRGFSWQATGPSGNVFRSADLHEEIELAMAEAEAFARNPPVSDDDEELA